MIRNIVASHIVDITVCDKRESFYWSFIPGRKNFWGKVIPDLYKDHPILSEYYTKQEAEEKYPNKIFADKIYNKPCLEISLTNDKSYIEYFESYQQAKDKAAAIIAKYKLSILVRENTKFYV